MNMLVFEDKWETLTPLTYLRPVFDLRCGHLSLLERIVRKVSGHRVGLLVRDYLKDAVAVRTGLPVNDASFFTENLAVVNGRWLIGYDETLNLSDEAVYVSGDTVVYAVLSAASARRARSADPVSLASLLAGVQPRREIRATVIEYPWHLVHHNPEMLNRDFAAAGKAGIEGELSPQAAVRGPKERLYIEEGAEVQPFAVLDTTAGPIWISRGAKVFPFSRVEGPAYLGEDVQIMPGASIREGNSFGPVCRVGGEVEESIFHGYGNKYHDGFIGHSYICEFVNLGALTTNSDLKNDYSAVSVPVNGQMVDTGALKVGSFIGDHTKTSIGVLLNTGSCAGVACNITAAGILPKYFPSFVWYVAGRYLKGFGFASTMETVRAAMARRGRVCSPEEEAVLRTVYEMTARERQEYVRKSMAKR